MGWYRKARLIAGPFLPVAWILMAVQLLMPCAAVVALIAGYRGPNWFATAQIAILVPMLLTSIPIWRHRRAFTAFIREHNGRVCTTCGYLLTPELDHKPCPECGTPIDLDLFRTQWIQALGGWKQFPPP